MAMRIQRKRTKGWQMSKNAVSVCRPGKFGNPFPIGKSGPLGRIAVDAASAVGFFRAMLGDPELRAAAGFPDDEAIKSALRGYDLACWCSIGSPCHADVLLEIANA